MKNTKEAEKNQYYDQVLAFQKLFTQPTPHYASKNSEGWRTVHRPLTWHVTNDHLTHLRTVGTLGRYYPNFGVLDFDDKTLSQVQASMSKSGLHEGNSMLFTSESANSYHLYFKPRYKGKPTALSYYTMLMNYNGTNGCEIYPQANRVIRLPFSKGVKLHTAGEFKEVYWQDGVAMLEDLMDYDLHYGLPRGDEVISASFKDDEALPLGKLTPSMSKGWRAEGKEYYQEGLTSSGSRVEATKRVVYYLWTQEHTPELAVELTKAWIKTKHNGFSKDWKSNYRDVYKQCQKIVEWVYLNFERQEYLPNLTQEQHNGWLTPAVVRQAVQASEGKLAEMRFNASLFSYVAPRCERKVVGIHSDKLKSFGSSKNYNSYLARLENACILKRHSEYSAGNYSKGISLTVQYDDPQNRINTKDDEERPASTLEEWLPAVYKEVEYYNELKQFGRRRSTIIGQIEEIWGENREPIPNIRAKADNGSRIRAFLEANPDARQKEVAQELGLSIRTVKTYWQEAKKVQSCSEITPHTIASLPCGLQNGDEFV
jgi:hypothetical protein